VRLPARLLDAERDVEQWRRLAGTLGSWGCPWRRRAQCKVGQRAALQRRLCLVLPQPTSARALLAARRA